MLQILYAPPGPALRRKQTAQRLVSTYRPLRRVHGVDGRIDWVAIDAITDLQANTAARQRVTAAVFGG